MKTFVLGAILATAIGFGFSAPAEQPRGSVLELHSCELYAGGCVVSSEAPLDGRYMLSVWNFTGGEFDGINMQGLRVASLQCSEENLAMAGTRPGKAVVYLPEYATPEQRKALLAWLKSSQADFKNSDPQTRVVPLTLSATPDGYAFSAGDFISVRTAGLESCQTGACGEALWYLPRSVSSLFTVAVGRHSRVTEPLLKLNWEEAGKRNVFLATFGASENSKSLFVTAKDLCGPAKLF